MKAEYDNIVSRHVWELCELPPGHQPCMFYEFLISHVIPRVE
jgi:hypothetical protein